MPRNQPARYHPSIELIAANLRPVDVRHLLRDMPTGGFMKMPSPWQAAEPLSIVWQTAQALWSRDTENDIWWNLSGMSNDIGRDDLRNFFIKRAAPLSEYIAGIYKERERLDRKKVAAAQAAKRKLEAKLATKAAAARKLAATRRAKKLATARRAAARRCAV